MSLEDILQDTWPVFHKTIKVVKDTESLRNCHKPETKETRQLNAILSQTPL